MSKYLKWACASAATLALLQGCGTSVVSKDVTDDGHAGEVVFPKIEDTAWLKEGTFPNLDNLRRIAPGITKDQLYDLVGRPHFSEGMSGVREWDYIFNFRTGKGSEYITCQYKVIFDKNRLGQSFNWAPASCADQLVAKTPPAIERIVERVVDRPTQQVAQKPAELRKMQVSGDVLFAFDRSRRNDVLPGGTKELDRIARELKAAGEIERLEVVGHTDRLGTTDYNQQLSEARAQTVREYLAEQGIPAARTTARGQGMNSPVVQCDQHQRPALIACLTPNRRVEFLAWVHPRS